MIWGDEMGVGLWQGENTYTFIGVLEKMGENNRFALLRDRMKFLFFMLFPLGRRSKFMEVRNLSMP
jgi:hypothetical protein